MPNQVKAAFLQALARKFGSMRKLENSNSLFEIGGGVARIYIRYSKLHDGRKTFYGLRAADLRELEGHPSVICFLWNDQADPLILPFSEYEDVFHSVGPADDGQYKAQVLIRDESIDLVVARAGRFNVDAYFGWGALDALTDLAEVEGERNYSHSQIQTLLGGIGASKGYDVWIPLADRARLEWSLVDRYNCRDTVSSGSESVDGIIREVDVIWIERGSTKLRALFEIEHSTPIYSGLLRFNDTHLASVGASPRYSIVANDLRRAQFVRQINRPTFRVSGLSDLCTFFKYVNVIRWHDMLKMGKDQ